MHKIILKLCLITVSWYIVSISFCQSSDYNFVKQQVPLQPVSDTTELNQLESKKKLRSVDFLDGEGRVIQTIIAGVTPDENDLIQTYVFDIAGRQTINYLPFPRATLKSAFVDDPVDKIIQFYEQPSANVASSTFPFVEIEFDNSPINEIVKEGAPGETWTLNGEHAATSHTYGNIEPITNWAVNENGQCSIKGSYYIGSLLVKETSDENKNISREYIDKTGKTILQETLLEYIRVQTYYVYDKKELLRFVLPPLASAKQNPDPKLIYEYNYDDRNRMVRKKLPGAEEIFIV